MFIAAIDTAWPVLLHDSRGFPVQYIVDIIVRPPGQTLTNTEQDYLSL